MIGSVIGTGTGTGTEIEIGGNRETSGLAAHPLLDEVELRREISVIETEMALSYRMLIDPVVDPETAVLHRLARQILIHPLECFPLDAAVASCVVDEEEEEATGRLTVDEDEQLTKIAAIAIPEVDLKRLDGVGTGIVTTVTAAIDTHQRRTLSGAIPEMTPVSATTAI